MKMIDLLEIIQDEKRTEDFLRSRGVLKTFTHCYKCNSTKVGMTRSDRWKCYTCEAEWTRRKGSILSLVRMKYSEFLLCMKFFELELTAEETAAQLKLNYKTVKYLYQYFSSVLIEKEFLEFNTNDLISGKEKLLRIYLCNGKIKLSYKDENLKQLALINIERKRIQNAEAYFDFEIKQLNKISDPKSIDPLLLKFIRFAKKRLYNYRGTAKKNLLLKFKEVEFRFNNSKVDIYDCLGKQISQNYKGG